MRLHQLPESEPSLSVEQRGAAAVEQLLQDPSAVVPTIIHRRPEQRQEVDFVHRVIIDPALQSLPSLRIDIAFRFVDRSMRIIERMSEPEPLTPPMHDDEPSSSAGHHQRAANSNSSSEIEYYTNDGLQPLRYGREAQTEAVKHLLSFLSSLLRRGIVAPDQPELRLQFDEITTQFAWMEQVRRFRRELEGGKFG